MPALGSEMSGIHLRSLEELRLRYGELAPGYGHLGVPELPEARDARAEAAKLEMKRRRLGQKLLVNAYPAELQILARFGVSPSLRREVWGACLGAKHGAALQERPPVAFASGSGSRTMCSAWMSRNIAPTTCPTSPSTSWWRRWCWR
ncbi:unnamed protein product [Effrenium voratum]|nr:unnamed protein product [Effrenium voratum]